MNRYDIIVIGLGPAGMAAAAMGAEMGLKVLAIEKHKIGGECNNVGCIPSKGLLKASSMPVKEENLFSRIHQDTQHIRDKKLKGMLDKVTLLLNKGDASFLDEKTVVVDEKQYTAKYIFIATGTHPFIPPIEGLKDVPYLTNETIFYIEKIPQSMTVIGGGAIGCELALAFSRLGCKCSIVQDREFLIPVGERTAGELLEQQFAAEGIAVHNKKRIASVSKEGDQLVLRTEDGLELHSETLLVAAGRKHDFSSLHLEKAGVEYQKNGIKVDSYLRTNKKHIHAVGDCNGYHLLSHTAMHQSMLALMNLFAPAPFKRKFKEYPVPWTVFTNPPISHVGKTSHQLDAEGVDYETIETKYADYGAAITEKISEGYLKVYIAKKSLMGKILGVSIVGANSGELINEWTLAMQHGLSLFHIMMTMHSFPTMGFLSKRIGETWAMGKMKSPLIRRVLRFLF